ALRAGRPAAGPEAAPARVRRRPAGPCARCGLPRIAQGPERTSRQRPAAALYSRRLPKRCPPMPLRLLPWQPEFGTSMQFDADEDAAAPAQPPDTRIERSVWQPVTPAGAPSLAVQVVDGVRRAEAHALDEADGMPVFGLF